MKKILVRTPNWLGDLVMSYAFFEKLKASHPQAEIDVVVKKGLHDLMRFYPVKTVYPFSKKEYGGAMGLMHFGRKIAKESGGYDVYFSLPDSFSTALIGRFVNATKRVGFQREMRSGLLTHHYPIPYHLHYVQRYAHLLESFTEQKLEDLHTLFPNVRVEPSEKLKAALSNESLMLFGDKQESRPWILFNPMAVAVSRTLSIAKSAAIFEYLNKRITANFVITGTPDAIAYTAALKEKLGQPQNLLDLTGKTTLLDLTAILRQCQAVLSVDSGPAHLSNALGLPTVVLTGAGDPDLIRPWNEKNRLVIRRSGLACSPCKQNTCKLRTVECLEDLEVKRIGEAVISSLVNK